MVEVPVIEEKVVKVYEKPQMTKIRREHVITFDSLPERVLCPNCHKLQFTVNQGPTSGSIVRVCDKCGDKTTYTFKIFSMGLTTSSPLF